MLLHAVNTVAAALLGGICLRGNGLLTVLCTETEGEAFTVGEDFKLRIGLLLNLAHGIVLYGHAGGVFLDGADGALSAVQSGIYGRIGNGGEVCGKQLKAEALLVLINHEAAGTGALFCLGEGLLGLVKVIGALLLKDGRRLCVLLKGYDALGGLNADCCLCNMVLHTCNTVLAAFLIHVNLRGDGHLAVACAETENELILRTENLKLGVGILDNLADGVVLHGYALCIRNDGANGTLCTLQSSVNGRFGDCRIVACLQLIHVTVVHLFNDESACANHVRTSTCE